MRYIDAPNIARGNFLSLKDGLTRGLVATNSVKEVAHFDFALRCEPDLVVELAEQFATAEALPDELPIQRELRLIITGMVPALINAAELAQVPPDLNIVVGDQAYALVFQDGVASVTEGAHSSCEASVHFSQQAFLAYWRQKIGVGVNRVLRGAPTTKDASCAEDFIAEFASNEIPELAAATLTTSPDPCIVNFCPPDAGDGCYSFACGIDMCAITYGCGLEGCVSDACYADLCPADICAFDGCGANTCMEDACFADGCGANASGGDICAVDLCGANACVADLGQICAANACVADVVPGV